MKLAGFLLMLAGWFIAVSALVLLHTVPAQTAFCVAGLGLQIFGFVIIARQHLARRRSKVDA